MTDGAELVVISVGDGVGVKMTRADAIRAGLLVEKKSAPPVANKKRETGVDKKRPTAANKKRSVEEGKGDL